MNFLNIISTIWNKISVMQRAVIIATLMACCIMSVLLTSWASKADMRPLYIGLSLEDAGKVTDQLTERGIAYELRGNGTSIYVARENVASARLEMAKVGLPETQQGGYKIFENTKISASPLVQQMNHKQAMEEELAKSIQMINCIEHARVLIVTPEQALFTQSKVEAKASITVKLKPGWTLSQGNIAAIINLASSAIEGLTPANVTIVNSDGKLLTKRDEDDFAQSSNTYQDYKQRVEQGLATKALNMLEAVLGPGRASVKVSADIDMTTVTTQTISYDKKGVPTKESINTTTKTKNTPKKVAAKEGATQQETTTEKEEKNETEMLVGKVVTNKVVAPGKINALSVAVVVDLSMPKPLVADSAAPTDATKTNQPTKQASPNQKIMTVEQVKEIIKNALGRELLTKEDALTVVDAPFVQTRMLEMPTVETAGPVGIEKYIGLLKDSSTAIVAFFAFLTLLIFGRSSKKQKKSSSNAEDQDELLEESPLKGILPELDTETPEIAYRKHVSRTLRQNPEEVKQLFASWIAEEV